MALTVSTPIVPPPSIALTAASDTGTRGDGITRVTRPTFTGLAPARSSVAVYADGQLLGVATATVHGAWRLATPAAKPLTSGAHSIAAYTFSQSPVPSAPTLFAVTVDPTPPTASVTYDSVNGRAIVTFSEPVSGVRASNLVLSGRTESGVTLANVPITNARARAYVGLITMTQSPDAKTFTFQEQLTLAEPGTYTLSFVKTGVVDRAGNRLAAGAATRFTII